MDVKKGEVFFNRSLERALQILNAFDARKRELSMTQLSKSLSLPTATVLRLCATLVRYGFLRQDPDSKRYLLGLRLFELGGFVFRPSIRRRPSARLTEEPDGNVFRRIFGREDLMLSDMSNDREAETGELSERNAAPDMEERTKAHAGIHRMAVVVVCDAPLGKDIREYVILEPEEVFDEIASFIEKRSVCRRQLPERIEFGEDLLPAKGGKVDEETLRDDVGNRIGR